MKIIFVRHGHPNYEKDCLTPLGHQQAAAAAKRLCGCGIETIFASSCGRAVETAEHTAKELGFPLDFVRLDFMREIYWSAPYTEKLYDGGHPWDTAELMVANGESLLSADWMERGRFAGNKVIESTRTVTDGFDGWMETLGYRREGDYYRVIGNDTNRTIALFSHGGSSSAVLAHLFNLPFPYVCYHLHLNYTAITVVTLPDDKGALVAPRLDLANDARHIEGIEGTNIFGN